MKKIALYITIITIWLVIVAFSSYMRDAYPKIPLGEIGVILALLAVFLRYRYDKSK